MPNNILKITFSGLLLTLSASSFAFDQYDNDYNPNCVSCYVGLQMGGCNLHESSIFDNARSIDHSNFASRLFIGLDLTPNLGIEAGLTGYESPEIHYRYASYSYSQLSFDLLGKLSLPVNPRLKFYAKGGIASVAQYNFQENDSYQTTVYLTEDIYLRPMVGAGLSYQFNRKLSGDLGAYHIFGEDTLPDTDFYAVGLTYRLG